MKGNVIKLFVFRMYQLRPIMVNLINKKCILISKYM